MRVRTLIAAALGALTALGFAPIGWWPLTILGVAGLTLLCLELAPRAAAGAGYAFGLSFFGITVCYVYVLGWWVAGVLIAFMALWMLLLAAATPLVGRLPGWPLWLACLWSGIEFCYSRVPFGGFGWSRLVFTTADQPLSGFLPVIGAAGTSLLVAWCGTLLALIVRGPGRAQRRAAAGLIIALFATGALLKARPVAPGGEQVAIGMVQGNVDGSAGPRAMGYARSVINNHLSQTVTLMADVRTGREARPDFLLWPENSSDLDPTVDGEARMIIDTAAELAQLPILLGAVMSGPGQGERQTSALWWVHGLGVVARTDKQDLVPFGEFTPMKSIVLRLIPMASMVGKQSVPGTGPGVLDVELPDGRQLSIGNIICYELAFDDTVAATVRSGAEVITVQSNNATYTGTFQPRQQFEITRIRAMELRREIVVSTTSSYSGLIDARGTVIDRTQEGTAASHTYLVPERTGVTPGAAIGGWVGAISALVALLAVLAGRFLVRPGEPRLGRARPVR